MTRLNVGLTTSFLQKLVFSLFVLLVIFVQTVNIFTSGVFDQKGNLIFYGDVLFHDSNVHLSLISEMQNRFPPTNFTYTMEGVKTLKNYHYLYDVLLAIAARVTHLSVFDLYYRFGPIVISFLLSVTIYLTALRLTKNKITATLAIFFTIFATSFGSILPYIKALFNASPVTGGSNIFMTDQMLDLLVNPHGGLILVIFLGLFLLLWQYEESRSKKYLFLYSLLLGLSFGVKAYGGIVFVPGAILCSVWFLISKKDYRPAFATFLGLVIMAAWIFTNVDRGVAGLQFAPGWLLEKMMIEMDRFNEPRFLLLLQHYQGVGNWLHIAILESAAFLIYLVGSLGIRIFGLVSIIIFLKKIKDSTPSQIFLFTVAIVSFIVPVFFNQSKKAYDIVQFTPYFTLFMGIMFAVFLFQIRTKWPIILALMIFFVWSDRGELQNRLTNLMTGPEKIVISKQTLAATSYIANRTPKNSIILLAPTSFNINKPWFPALTGRQTVYCCRGFAFQVGVDTDKAEQSLKDIFSGGIPYQNFDYIFLSRAEEGQFAKIKELYSLQSVFENSEVVIFKKV